MAVICSNCGWCNPDGSRRCEKCNTSLTYDVFISYSRKDYVDDVGNVLDDNILSKIKSAFKANGITYWFDEEGIYTGDEFASVLTDAIRNSRLFLFISSVYSNQSNWTSNEISTALEFKKIIIPFRLDKSPYNDSVMMKIVAFDYIECKDVEKAISKLLRAVKHHLQSSINSQKKKSIIDVPEGAIGATVIFDVGGEKTENIFSYKDGDTLFPHEKVTSINHSPIQNSQKSNGLIKKLKAFWSIIAVILLLIIAVGLITFYYKGKVVDNSQTVTIQKDIDTIECQPIDMGLPSGTLWGDRNLGAKTIYECGDLYAWGELSTKTVYNENNYNLLSSPQTISSSTLDIAYIKYGKGWSLPSVEQFEELEKECDWFKYENDSISGLRVISRKNGNEIFLPINGFLDTNLDNQCGYYWTSEISKRNHLAREFFFSLRNSKISFEGTRHIGDGLRFRGQGIRAVYSNAVNTNVQ